MQQLTSNTEGKSRPELFTQLVHTMRKLTHSQLVQIFQSYENLQRLLLDALPLLKTEAAVTLMRDLFEAGSVSGQVLDTWFATLPYYKNPTRGMLNSVLARLLLLLLSVFGSSRPLATQDLFNVVCNGPSCTCGTLIL